MNAQSARSLAWLAAILIVIGLLIMSPSAALALFCLAGIFAFFPARFGSRSTKLIGTLLLLACLGLAAAYYPSFKKDHESYRDRVRKGTADIPVVPSKNADSK